MTLVAFTDEDFSALVKQVGEHERILRGNNGTPGLIESLRTTCIRDDELNRLQHILLGNPENREDVGLKGDVRDLLKVLAQIRKLMWIFIGSVVVGIVELGFLIFAPVP